jgi:molybdopterin-biosynthesis enzyme MoeA-like protein
MPKHRHTLKKTTPKIIIEEKKRGRRPLINPVCVSCGKLGNDEKTWRLTPGEMPKKDKLRLCNTCYYRQLKELRTGRKIKFEVITESKLRKELESIQSRQNMIQALYDKQNEAVSILTEKIAIVFVKNETKFA